MTDQIADGRKRRKRRSRSKTGRKNAAAAEALRKKWQDPAYREKQSKVNREVLPVGRRTRSGVPDGMTRVEAEPLWEKAKQDADIAMSALEKQGRLVFDPDLPEDEMARIAMRELFVLAFCPMGNQQLKISALHTLLLHTKPKPAAKSEITVQQEAEAAAWLQSVIEDDLATTQSATNVGFARRVESCGRSTILQNQQSRTRI